MLFPLDRTTPQCRVFEVLNNELLHFLHACIQATTFDKSLFSRHQRDEKEFISICWTNVETKEKFKVLWDVLPTDQEARQALFDQISDAQDIWRYFDDIALPLPELTELRLFNAFKALTTHLFTRTKDLAGAKVEANSSIEQHFQAFRKANDSTQLCYLCGTAHLSQDRTNLNDNDQWRADYDHILCKDKYPIYSVHPGNFIPTCHICNSKAKGARNVLKCSENSRRTAFYPLPPGNGSCYQYAVVIPQFRDMADLVAGNWEDPVATATLAFPTASADIASKIEVWKEVYQVPTRVEEHIISNFCERISSDLRATDFNDFCAQLKRFSNSMPMDYQKAEWRFWWHRVYEYLVNQNQDFLRDVWSLIEWKLNLANDNDMQATFGI